MSGYLARLKRLLAEERSPEEPTKPTEAPSVAFVSGQGSPFCADEAAIEERAGLAADRVPAVYLDPWAWLNHRKPFDVSEADWPRALDDGGRFLDAWGNEAAEAGWTPGELFDVGPGLIWRLAGRCAEALAAGSCSPERWREAYRASRVHEK
jgi:hypothetical protein